MKTDLTEENQSVVMGTAMSPAELQQGIPTSSAFQLLGNGSFLLRCPSWRGTRGFCILDQSPEKVFQAWCFIFPGRRSPHSQRLLQIRGKCYTFVRPENEAVVLLSQRLCQRAFCCCSMATGILQAREWLNSQMEKSIKTLRTTQETVIL